MEIVLFVLYLLGMAMVLLFFRGARTASEDESSRVSGVDAQAARTSLLDDSRQMSLPMRR